VNVPVPLRVLVNTRNPDQQGVIYDLPGTIIDVVADPIRDRFYVLRQDQNRVIAFEGTGMTPIATLRTGNTPVQMAIAQDQLLVTNDNSQLVNVFDLSSLTPRAPVLLPSGLYARSIVAANGSILAATRNVTGKSALVTIDLFNRIANTASTSIYKNEIDVNTVLTASPSGSTIFMAMTDGTVALYDTGAKLFFASRKDVGSLSGAYAALSDNLYMAGSHVFGTSLVPAGELDVLGGITSGATVIETQGILTSAPAGARNGVIQRFSLDQLAPVSPARTAEQPILLQAVGAPPLGQLGRTILPFTRTLAPLANRQSIVQLSTSGFTAIPWQFDAPSQPPVINAVTNSADQGPGLAPGGLISLWGTGLGSGSAAPPLANGLVNVCLYANSIAVPILYASSGQINAQLPYNVGSASSLVLNTAGGASAPFNFTTQAAAPAVFRMGDGTPTIFREVDGKLITESTPIHLNQKFTIYLTGLGSVSPGVTAGIPAPSDPLASTTALPKVYLGPTQLFTLWSGLVPGLMGVNQINVQVPFNNVSTGSKVQLAIIQGDVQTKLLVPVQP
jgi:uncharacterized protein (TIGR03437 family)